VVANIFLSSWSWPA
jgi:hypothetical protein